MGTQHSGSYLVMSSDDVSAEIIAAMATMYVASDPKAFDDAHRLCFLAVRADGSLNALLSVSPSLSDHCLVRCYYPLTSNSIPALFAYDYAITFTCEVQYFWKRTRSLASILFLAIRYCYLMNCIVIMLGRVLHPSVMVRCQTQSP